MPQECQLNIRIEERLKNKLRREAKKLDTTLQKYIIRIFKNREVSE